MGGGARLSRRSAAWAARGIRVAEAIPCRVRGAVATCDNADAIQRNVTGRFIQTDTGLPARRAGEKR